MELALATIEDMDSKILVKLTVRPLNKRAIQCYKKVGFKITREYYEDSYLIPGEMYEMILERENSRMNMKVTADEQIYENYKAK